jgi:SAM-dependent methyltransferase
MTQIPVAFDDGDAYERYMGRWSRAIGQRFLEWLDPPENLRWLDVGCGTGAFTKLILDRTAPSSTIGIDPSPAQVAHARRSVIAPQVEFRESSASNLPFETGTFDMVASGLVIHFFEDRPQAFREMLRVTRSGGTVAGYTWRKSATIIDAPYGPLARAVIEVAGDVMISPAVPEAMPEGLRATLVAAGYADIDITTLEGTQIFRDFEDYWTSQTGTFTHPVAKSVAALNDDERKRVRDIVRTALPAAADGTITYASRATAFKARKPR